MKISNAAAITLVNAFTALLDAGAGPAFTRIFDGVAPGTCDDPDAGTVLAQLTFGDPAFNPAVDTNPGASATAHPIAGDLSADADGAAVYFRNYDSNGTCLSQGPCGPTGSGAELQINAPVNGSNQPLLTTGQPVDITAFTITLSEG